MGTLSEVRSRRGYTGNGRLISTCRRDDRLLSKKRFVTGILRRQICNNTYAVFEGLQSPGKPSVITFHAGGASARHPQVVLPFAARHRRARLAWCTQRWRWNNNQCSHVMYSAVLR